MSSRVARIVGAASSLATLTSLRFEWGPDDRLAYVRVFGAPLYSRKRALARLKRRRKRERAAELDAFGGRR